MIMSNGKNIGMPVSRIISLLMRTAQKKPNGISALVVKRLLAQGEKR